MKHIKGFNEELKSIKYLQAAGKLKKLIKDRPTFAKAIGAEERSKKLEDWAKEVENIEKIKRWEKKVQELSKYGEITVELSRPGSPITPSKQYQFYVSIGIDAEMTIENFEDHQDPENRFIPLRFWCGLVPKTIEDFKDISQNYTSEFYNGFMWAFWIDINYKITDSRIERFDVTLNDYEMDESQAQIADRKSAVALKKLVTNIFDDKFDYPSGYTDVPNMHDKIESSIIQFLEIESTYGIDMWRIKEDIKKVPTSNFYVW